MDWQPWQELDANTAMPSAEHIRVACRIMTSCVLLGGLDFLREHGQRLGSTLAELTGSVNERGTLLLLPVEELLLQVQGCAVHAAHAFLWHTMVPNNILPDWQSRPVC